MTVVIVTGFHRSGTSMIAELLERAGVHLGDDLIGANPSNPRGHFEDRAIVRFHDLLLADNGLTWQVDRPVDPVVSPQRHQWMAEAVAARSHHARWGFKDPRACFFLDAWRHHVPDMRVVIVYRDPRDCAWSLERRHASALLRGSGSATEHRRFWEVPDLALRMWVAHNRTLLDIADRHPEHTVILAHADVVQGLPVADTVNATLGTDLDPVATPDVVEPALMTRRPGRQAVSSTDTIDQVLAVWGDLEARATRNRRREDAHGHA